MLYPARLFFVCFKNFIFFSNIPNRINRGIKDHTLMDHYNFLDYTLCVWSVATNFGINPREILKVYKII